MGFEVDAGFAGGTKTELKLIIAFLAFDHRFLVVLSSGQAEQGHASVAGNHRGLESADTHVDLA